MKGALHKVAGGLIPAAIAVALAASMAPGCTTHGEGGRCDSMNLNADCDNGLVCIHGDDIILPEGGTSQADICCPVDRSSLTPGDICYLNTNAPGSDAGIPDTGTDVTVDQSSSDVTTDVTDAPSDAPADTTEDATDATGD
jgi:hypothetical protein